VKDFIIIGGGIVGLSVGKALLERFSKASVVLLEKEAELAAHQSGNNSGVIHSGVYYVPGSQKAKFAKAGNESMKRFCQEHGIKYEECGKVIVATDKKEIGNLIKLYERGKQNGLDVQLLDKVELLEKEPYVNGMKAIFVPGAGIVDYKQVSLKMAELIEERGGEIRTNEEVKWIDERPGEVIVETEKNTFRAKFLINCAGLYSDRIAEMAGYKINVKIFPFRGEYYNLADAKQHMVNHLIYPVSNPEMPFLGVHFTRTIDGKIDVGPNAVLGFKREAYRKTSFDVTELKDMLTYPGFWKLSAKYFKVGVEETIRSYSKKLFVKSAQKLIPDITEDDLVPAPAGVRAQALKNDGSLVDDFYVINGKNSIHVCNAPSPAATASLEIGREIVKQVNMAAT